MASVQDVLNITDYFLNDYGAYTSNSVTADASGATTFGVGSPIAYQSETVAVNGAAKTRTTHYNVNSDTGEVTFTSGNVPSNGQVVVITATVKKFPFSTKLAGIKAALSKYYYITHDTTFSLTGSTQSIDISSASIYEVIDVELDISTNGEYFKGHKGWRTNTRLNPTTIWVNSKYSTAYPVRLKVKKKYSTALTTPASTIDANFPSEYACQEVLGLWAAYVCATGARVSRVLSKDYPSAINENIARASDYRTLANDIFATFKTAEAENMHLLKPPYRARARVVG